MCVCVCVCVCVCAPACLFLNASTEWQPSVCSDHVTSDTVFSGEPSCLLFVDDKSDTSVHTGELIVNTRERGVVSRWLLQSISHLSNTSWDSDEQQQKKATAPSFRNSFKEKKHETLSWGNLTEGYKHAIPCGHLYTNVSAWKNQGQNKLYIGSIQQCTVITSSNTLSIALRFPQTGWTCHVVMNAAVCLSALYLCSWQELRVSSTWSGRRVEWEPLWRVDQWLRPTQRRGMRPVL